MDSNNIPMYPSNTSKSDLGKRITISREHLGISKSKLSQNMHLSRSICGQWEQGISNPSTAHLSKLATLLNVSFEWLATGRSVVNEPLQAYDADAQDLSEKHKMYLLKMTELFGDLNLAQKESLVKLLESMVSS